VICQPWITEADLAACDCDATGLAPSRLADLMMAASETLYMLSGSVYSGPCTRVLRPCHALGQGGGPLGQSHQMPALIGGQWWNLGGCGCGSWDMCTCRLAGSILLPVDHPISATVRIDGAVVTDFRLEGRSLWRRSWPCCQDLSLPDTQPGTWSVTVVHGLDPPVSGKLAASALAAELVRACQASKSCRLPLGISSAVRQGVTIDASEFAELVSDGHLGLAEVDVFLAAVNPGGLRRRARFVSPDVPASLG
jgi:hypothetical protein